jgi:phosphopantothenoylcysteine decarboxylase/phosphopantothenate--cysteine ligase
VERHHVFIAVAAVADWRVANASARKLKKNVDGAMPPLRFEQNPDILASVAALPNKPYCVGFAAESDNLLEYGRTKREKKGIPLLVGNIGPSTFGSDRNELVLFDQHGHTAVPAADKLHLARQLINEIASRLDA